MDPNSLMVVYVDPPGQQPGTSDSVCSFRLFASLGRLCSLAL